MSLDDSGPALVALLVQMIGQALKAWPAFPDKFIPIACMAIGCAVHMTTEGFTARNAIVGLCAGGAAVGLHQAGRQLKRSPK